MASYPESAFDNAAVPGIRVRPLNDHAVCESGDFVLYWMIAFRRTHWNFALQRAVEWASELRKPLVVLEALRCDYKWASDRLHAFVIQGMADNQQALADRPAFYYPYLERSQGDGSGLLEALATRAAVVVADDFPAFFLPRMLDVAARKVDVRLEAVDSNGLYPMRATDKVFARAFDFRRHLQKDLPTHLEHFPQPDPLEGHKLPKLAELPAEITHRWPAADVAALAKDVSQLSEFPIDHDVKVVPSLPGGEEAAGRCLDQFLKSRLPRYGEERGDPDSDAASGFSPYLHFGHLSAHQVFAEVAKQLKWSPAKLSRKVNGSREGWWGVDSSTESFLDELITWREVGYNMCSHRGDYARYSTLPDWAQKTLSEHAADEREHLYTLEEFEHAKTHDEIWNAAQRQLVVEGRIHNYLRMLWGKKILEWSATPEQALRVMIELNNKYALDGRNPNSYSGIFWVLGRYDRAWGPERPIYGKIRYMSSDNTARKIKLKNYLDRYSAKRAGQRELF
jgi:deoxyribodipyrimidine photo-lyase